MNRTPRSLALAALLIPSCMAEEPLPPLPQDVASAVAAVAALPGEPSVASAGGLSASGERMHTLEDTSPFEVPQRRLVVVGGLDGNAESALAVLTAVQWFKSRAGLGTEWTVSALPCALPERCAASAPGAGSASPVFPPEDGYYNDEEERESRYLWRWVAFQAPDLVLEIRAGDDLAWEVSGLAGGLGLDASEAPPQSLAAALSGGAPSGLAPVPAIRVTVSVDGAPAMLEALLDAASSLDRSPLRAELAARLNRSPLEVAAVLAGRYPATPSMSYIPSISWSNTLRLADRVGDPSLVEKVRGQMAPFLSGETPTIAEPYRLTSLAGHLAFVDFAGPGDNDEAMRLAMEGADFIMPRADEEIVRFPRAWTDDMFMATSVLARIGARTSEARYSETVARLLTSYADELQRPDGLFMHGLDGPHAWGRGNGFALLGLTEALTYLPDDWSARADVLDVYRRHVDALVNVQAADGMWRQVLDEPGSYREMTVTSMTLVALARGVRLGWLDDGYRSTIDRGWRALSAHVAMDGALVDVCTGTGSGEPRAYYLDRAAIFGPDDRGGAMALWAAMEIDELQ